MHSKNILTIVYVIPYYRLRGALAYVLGKLTKGIPKYFRKYKVKIVIIAQGEHEKIKHDNIFISKRDNVTLYIACRGMISRLIRKLEFVNLLRGLIRILLSYKNPLILHAFFAYPSGLAAVIFAILNSVFSMSGLRKNKTIITIGGDDVEYVPSIKYGRCLDSLIKLLTIFTLFMAKIIVAPSDYASSCIKSLTPFNGISCKILKIPYGIEPADYICSEKKRNIPYRRIKGFKKSSEPQAFILSLCRLHPKKGLIYLLYAFKVLKEFFRQYDLKLLIAGEGSQYQYLRGLVKKLKLTNDVTFLGYVTREEKISLLTNCLVYVLPSLSDVFALSLIEAVACGAVAVVTPNVGSICYLLRYNYPQELIVKPKDLTSLVKAMIYAIENYKLLKKKIKSVRDKAYVMLSTDYMIRAYAILYKMMLRSYFRY